MNKEYHRQYYLKNKDKILARRMVYYEKNKVMEKEKMKANRNKSKIATPWMFHHKTAKGRCADKSNPNYGGKGIKFLLTKDEVKQLWVRDNAHLLSKPSIDRKDTCKNYEFENCRFVEYSENARRGR